VFRKEDRDRDRPALEVFLNWGITYYEGHIFFQIPIEQNPEELHFKVGIIGPTQAKIIL